MKILLVGAVFFYAGGRTGGDIVTLTVAFRDFVKAPRTVVLPGAGIAVRSAAGLNAPTLSYLKQIQHSQLY